MSSTDFVLRTIIDANPARQGARRVRSELQKVGREADNVGTKGTKAFKYTAKAAKEAGDGMDRVSQQFKKFFFLFGGIFLIRNILKLGDEAIRLENRLRVVTDTAEELDGTFGALANMAIRTRASFSATVEMFTRLSLVTRQLGVSQASVGRVTETINKAVQLSGATAKEATNGIIQLSQAMASGTLRGDELRSVLEQLPAIATIIQEHLGVTRGELRKLGEQGKLTSDLIFNALQGAAKATDEAFAELDLTVAGTFENLKTSTIASFRELDKLLGVTDKLKAGLDFLAKDILVVIDVIAGMVVTFFAVKAATKAWTISLRVLSLQMVNSKFPLTGLEKGIARFALAFNILTKRVVAGALLMAKSLLVLTAQFAVISVVFYLIQGVIGVMRKAIFPTETLAEKNAKLAGSYDKLATAAKNAGGELALQARMQARSAIVTARNRIDFLDNEIANIKGDPTNNRTFENWGPDGKSITVLSMDAQILVKNIEKAIDAEQKLISDISRDAGAAEDALAELYQPLTDELANLNLQYEAISQNMGDSKAQEAFIKRQKIVNKLLADGADETGLMFRGMTMGYDVLVKAVEGLRLKEEADAESTKHAESFTSMIEKQRDRMVDMRKELELSSRKYAEWLAIQRMIGEVGDGSGNMSAEQYNTIVDMAIAEVDLAEKLKLKNNVTKASLSVMQKQAAHMADLRAQLRLTSREYAEHSIAMRLTNDLTEESGPLNAKQIADINRQAAEEANLVDQLRLKNAVLAAIAPKQLTGLELNRAVTAGVITQAQAQGYLAAQITATADETDKLSDAMWKGFAQTALGKTETAIADFVMRGKGNFKSFVNSVMEDLLRMILRMQILLPLIQAMQAAFNFGSPMTDAAIQNQINTMPGGGPVIAGSGKQNGGSWMVGNGVPRFATGGSFNVGGNGGTDSQLVSFRASPNEQVTVTRPEQRGGGSTVNVVVNNNAPGTQARQERRADGGIDIFIERVKQEIANDIARGGTALNAGLEGRYPLNPAAGIQ
jgi:tape measure domain-containing protein